MGMTRFEPSLVQIRRAVQYHYISNRQNLVNISGSQLPYQKSQEISRWTFDYHIEKSESFCDETPGLQAGHRKVRFRGFVWGK